MKTPPLVVLTFFVLGTFAQANEIPSTKDEAQQVTVAALESVRLPDIHISEKSLGFVIDTLKIMSAKAAPNEKPFNFMLQLANGDNAETFRPLISLDLKAPTMEGALAEVARQGKLKFTYESFSKAYVVGLMPDTVATP